MDNIIALVPQAVSVDEIAQRLDRLWTAVSADRRVAWEDGRWFLCEGETHGWLEEYDPAALDREFDQDQLAAMRMHVPEPRVLGFWSYSPSLTRAVALVIAGIDGAAIDDNCGHIMPGPAFRALLADQPDWEPHWDEHRDYGQEAGEDGD